MNQTGLFNRWIGTGLAAALLSLPLPGQAPGAGSLAPLNPAFLEWQSRGPRPQGEALPAGPAGARRPLGYVPSPVDLSRLGGPVYRNAFTLGSGGAFPSTYDLRTLGRLTPIRDQDPFGCCWAFGAMASMESNLLTLGLGSYDLSEWHLAWFAYNDFSPSLVAFTKNTVAAGEDSTFDQGGNNEQSVAILGRGTGAASEASCPYQNTRSYSTSSRPTGKEPDVVMLKEAYSYGFTPAASDLKTAVTDYGATAIAIYWDDASYDITYASYRYTGSGTNHLVDIVGWDDNFPAAHFPGGNQPGSNGAWIMRNHWGASWGDKGYFYLSYDSTIVDAWVFIPAPVTYTRIYQYDPLGWVERTGYGSPTAYFANVFTAQASESINAVSFYSGAANSTYSITVRTGVSGDPSNGTVALGPQTGTLVEPGYRRVALASPVALTANQKFAVVLQLTTPGYDYPIPIQTPVGGYSTEATAAAGQGYISHSGTSWQDITAAYANTAVCLKAFATPGKPAVTSFSPISGPAGTVVALAGSGFTGATAVAFNGTPAASFTVQGDTGIQATVAGGSTSGPVTVTTPAGTTTSSAIFTMVSPPAVASFSPLSGPDGTTVALAGSGFTGATAVAINGTAAGSFTVKSDTALTFTVGTGSTTGLIRVTAPGGTTSSASPFTVSGVSMSGVYPDHGMPGTGFMVTGTGLGGCTALTVNGTPAPILANTGTQISSTVPVGATTGPVSVTCTLGTVTAGVFTVLGCDLDGDGTMDVRDLAVLAAGYGKNVPAAELDGNSTVDDQDITLWLQAF